MDITLSAPLMTALLFAFSLVLAAFLHLSVANCAKPERQHKPKKTPKRRYYLLTDVRPRETYFDDAPASYNKDKDE